MVEMESPVCMVRVCPLSYIPGSESYHIVQESVKESVLGCSVSVCLNSNGNPKLIAN